MLWVLICTVHLIVCSYHVTCAFQSESTLYNYLNVKELLARSRREIWGLSDCNWTRTHIHLVHKWALNHLAQTGQMIELCCEYLSVRCVWLYVLIILRTRIRVSVWATWLSVRLWTKWLWVRVQLQSHVNLPKKTLSYSNSVLG